MPECTLAPHVDDFIKKSQSFGVSILTLRIEFAKCPKCDHCQTCALLDGLA